MRSRKLPRRLEAAILVIYCGASFQILLLIIGMEGCKIQLGLFLTVIWTVNPKCER